MSPSKVKALVPPNDYGVARQLGSHLFFNEIIGLTSSSMVIDVGPGGRSQITRLGHPL